MPVFYRLIREQPISGNTRLSEYALEPTQIKHFDMESKQNMIFLLQIPLPPIFCYKFDHWTGPPIDVHPTTPLGFLFSSRGGGGGGGGGLYWPFEISLIAN